MRMSFQGAQHEGGRIPVYQFEINFKSNSLNSVTDRFSILASQKSKGPGIMRER
jgi:hypothetical protein